MIPSTLIVDLSGPRRLRAVRIIDGHIYGEAKTHAGADAIPYEDSPEIVYLGPLDGEQVEEKPGRKWSAGEWNVVRHGGCGCGGRLRALKAFTP